MDPILTKANCSHLVIQFLALLFTNHISRIQEIRKGGIWTFDQETFAFKITLDKSVPRSTIEQYSWRSFHSGLSYEFLAFSSKKYDIESWLNSSPTRSFQAKNGSKTLSKTGFETGQKPVLILVLKEVLKTLLKLVPPASESLSLKEHKSSKNFSSSHFPVFQPRALMIN